MARPLKNNADYFSHDKGMRDDPKIKAIRQRYGSDGYAAWCMLLETLTDADNFRIEYNELEVELMSGDFGIDAEKLQQIVESFRRLKLIVIESEILFCPKLVQRMQGLLDDRERKRQWVEQKKTGVNGFSTSKTGFVQSETPQSKVKESKVKESSINNRERDAQARGIESENEKSEEGARDTTPPVPPPPSPAPSDAAYQWAVSNLDFLRESAKQASYTGRVKDQVLKFCAHYSEHDAFCNQPVRFFKNKFAGWLVTARENAGKPGPGKKRKPTSPSAGVSPADQVTREKVLLHLRSAHAGFAAEFTESDISTLVQSVDMPAVRERCAEMLKRKMNDTTFQTSRGGETSLAAALGNIPTA